MTAEEIAAKRKNGEWGERREKATRKREKKEEEEELRNKLRCPACGAERDLMPIYGKVYVVCLNCGILSAIGKIMARE